MEDCNRHTFVIVEEMGLGDGDYLLCPGNFFNGIRSTKLHSKLTMGKQEKEPVSMLEQTHYHLMFLKQKNMSQVGSS